MKDIRKHTEHLIEESIKNKKNVFKQGVRLNYLYNLKPFLPSELQKNDPNTEYHLRTSNFLRYFTSILATVVLLILFFKGELDDPESPIIFSIMFTAFYIPLFLHLVAPKTLTIDNTGVRYLSRGKVKKEIRFDQCAYIYYKSYNNSLTQFVFVSKKGTTVHIPNDFNIGGRDLGLILYEKMKNTPR